ncbi:hypothetical protein DMW06_22215 [Vibrio parahaemolyticus]|nr:hypothetical protein [Vibrio parahaemolyticus]
MSKLVLSIAAREYFARARGKKSPKGSWVNNMYFIPDTKREAQKCCKNYDINPISMWEHCKSIEHIATSYQVKTSDLEITINELIEVGRKRKKGKCSI